MKTRLEENKRIKLELNKMIDESNQICRILDKDDVDVEFINQIGKKTYLKTPNARKKNLLPNLIYHQGQLTDNIIKKNNNLNKIQFKGIFSPDKTKSNFYKKPKMNNIKKLNDFHSNFFKILKGLDNDKIINTLIVSQNYGKNKVKNKKEEKKIENKLNKIVPDIMEKKKLLTKRLPLYIRNYRKNFEYINNQLILDEMNEKRYVKYDDPFIYSLNRFPSKDVLPKYNNLFFKYEKSKIRDYFYKNTFTNFHSTHKDKNKYKIKELKFDTNNYTSNDFNLNKDIIK